MSIAITEVETVSTKYRNVVACKVKSTNSILKFTLVNLKQPIENKTTLFLSNLKFDPSNKTCHACIVNPREGSVGRSCGKRHQRPDVFEGGGSLNHDLVY